MRLVWRRTAEETKVGLAKDVGLANAGLAKDVGVVNGRCFGEEPDGRDMAMNCYGRRYDRW